MPTLLEELGGREAVELVVAAFYDRVLADDLGRTQPDEDFEGNKDDQQPIQLADKRNEVKLERRGRKQQEQSQQWHQFSHWRNAPVAHQPVKDSPEAGQMRYESADAAGA